MRKSILCLLLVLCAGFCLARGKQDVIVTEDSTSTVRDVVVTIANSTEADFQTLVVTKKSSLSEKKEVVDKRTFSLRVGESKSIVLDNHGLYKLELYDSKGHRFSKKNTFSQTIMDRSGNVVSEGEYQQFTQPWQKIVFTTEDFEPQAVLDIIEVFFGIYGNEQQDVPPVKTCAAIVVNNTNEPVDYICVEQEGNPKSANITIDRKQCGVWDIRRDVPANISLISRSHRVYAKTDLVFDSENVTIVFTKEDTESDTVRAARFMSDALNNISSALTITSKAFTSFFGIEEADEFEEVDIPLPDNTGVVTGKVLSQASVPETPAATEPEPEATRKKSWWSWLPWVD